jgi:hypothetical protein
MPSGDLHDRGFAVRTGAVHPQVCTVATTYALLQAAHQPRVDGVASAHSVYADTLTESLEEVLWPEIERIAGEELWPTYSYYRVYRRGSDLRPHTDRVSCEISATVCLGADYAGAPRPDYNWPIWVQLPGSSDEAPHACRMEPGDMVIYRGCDVVHWREPFEGEWQVQAFLHYVRKNGPFAVARYDCRPGLGAPLSSRDPDRLRQVRSLDAFFDKEWDPRVIRKTPRP